MLRVTSGKHGGRKLEQPDLKITRPTTDRAKEAVFSMIQFKVKGSIFLDLFSGSGSMAIEAVSRDALKAFAIENNSNAIKIINKNLDALNINNVSVIKSDAATYINSSKGRKFDFIFMDPPYGENLYNSVIKSIKNSELLAETGWLIIETSRPNEIEIPSGFVLIKSKKYGKSSILIVGNNI